MGGKTGGRNHFSRPTAEKAGSSCVSQLGYTDVSHTHIQLKRMRMRIIVCAGSYVVRHLEFMELVKHV